MVTTKAKKETFTKKVIKAAEVYGQRKDREAHPAGTFDNASRFYPSDAEHQECCRSVRSPSRSWPYSLMQHCRTAEHVAHLYNVDVKELRRAYKKVVTPRLERRQVLNYVRHQQPNNYTGKSDTQRVFWQPRGNGGEVRECLERSDAWMKAARFFLAPSKADAQALAEAVDAAREDMYSIGRVRTSIGNRVECVYTDRVAAEIRSRLTQQRAQDAVVANSPDYGPELTAVSL